MPKKKRNSKKKATVDSSWFVVNGISPRSKLLFIIGILLIIAPIFFYVNEGIQLAFFTPKVISIVHRYSIPEEISIPAVGIDLPIFETEITNHSWEIAQDGISHLNISANPGEDGASILYAHNTNDRFGPIRWLTKGEKIIIVTKDKKRHVYTIQKTFDTNPNNISVLTANKKETLILYTCDGFADLQRFLVIAQPE